MRKTVIIVALALAASYASAGIKRHTPNPPPAPPKPIELDCEVGKDTLITPAGLAVLSCSKESKEFSLLSPAVGQPDTPTLLEDGSYLHKLLYLVRKTTGFSTEICGPGVIAVSARHYADGDLDGQKVDADRPDCVKHYFKPFDGAYEVLVRTQAPDTSFNIRTAVVFAPPPPPPPPPPMVMPPVPPPAPPP